VWRLHDPVEEPDVATLKPADHDASIEEAVELLASLRGSKTTVRLENDAFLGVHQSFETLHASHVCFCSDACDMPTVNDWNEKIIAEFRANEGRVGGRFEGAPIVLLHHRGRKSGREYVNPVMYLLDESDKDTIYAFATKAGAPSNPDWYYNLIAAGAGTVERGTETYHVTVRELTGDERDRVYDEQARRYSGFANYAQQTAGIRTIPVLELRRT